MRKITKRQSEVLETISQFIDQKGYPPSYRQLMKELGVNSPSTVKGLLDALKRKEYITWQEGLPRTLRLLEERAQQN
ncbi:transcriptional regulator [Bacillus atrophaeus]|uniref:LexA family protein n=1 Tax=Bacillus atrophaeus TaxID=1452 RepID=UPI000D05DEE4|nr:transcriptional regulator [Bacillus atrophaeus]MCY8513575.1 transcriptional regulator [Bacillus atrophaeus]MCY8992679.1 transcriptional regulator [Bacillus atrophaeus]MCY9159928.1 transcriptional regulator [Bacillus atrophaeus]MEC0935394.1 transcriptional regulator [Bacillus atrophaeus]MED4802669.1 transcriptional regulator [Bacillus atrophaeus]